MFDHFKGQIALHIGDVELTPSDFQADRFAAKWAEAGAEAIRQRTQRLTSIAAKKYDNAFGTLDAGGDIAKCVVCGYNDAVKPDDDPLERLCRQCRDYEELGREIRNARWLVRTEPTSSPVGFNEFCRHFGFEFSLLNKPNARISRIKEVVEINSFDPAETRDTLRVPQEAPLGYRFLAQSWPQAHHGGAKTFEEMAASSTGAPKLGVFRADLDNLGALFSTGLGARATISRVASLSAALVDFFEGYLNHLVASRYGDTLGIVYSGGDDLFVVGAWNHAIDFALELRNRLADFTGNHPHVTLSGGISVIDHALPIRFAADLAEDAENASKSYARNGKTKDALTLFGTTVGFEEMERFVQFRRRLEDMLTDEKNPMPAGFLRRLFEVWEVYLRERTLIEKNRRGADLEMIRIEARWRRWRWTLVYNLHRFARCHAQWESAISDIQRRILDPYNPIDDRLGLPLRWTELLIRKEE